MSSDRPLVLATELEHVRSLNRLFHDGRVTFWFDDPNPASRAQALGIDVLVLPQDPLAMYAAAHLSVRCMHRNFQPRRDLDKEAALVDRVVDEHGPSFILVWPGKRGLNPRFLPKGIPLVDASSLEVDEPFQLCGLMERALQVHAGDTWFLTLADLLPSGARKFCHAYADALLALSVRRKYRRQVTVISKARTVA